MTYSPDRPLENPEDDVLGYAQFSENIAKAITNMKADSGFVIGLHGEWGTGKSTVINFIEHYLNQNEEQDVIVFRFAPWMFSGTKNLIQIFFEHLQATLMSEDEKIARARAEKIATLFKGFSETVSKVVPGAKILGELAKYVPENFNPTNLVKFKKLLDDALKELGKKIFIIIDDIDRLTASEIQQIFQMVKSVADFSNVIYLLSFDTEIVAKALNEVQNNDDGQNYLEKIIQLQLTLPTPTSNAITNMFYNQLNEIIPLDIPNRDEERLNQLYEAGIRELLKTPRDATRLSNALRFTFPMVAGEVNVADFIAIEAIRIFKSKIYNLIRNNKARFLEPASYFTPTGQTSPQEKQYVEFHSQWFETD